MACLAHSGTAAAEPGTSAQGLAMTRCECAGVPFAEIARRLREEGATLSELCGRTGCGQTCTACLADLALFLRSAR